MNEIWIETRFDLMFFLLFGISYRIGHVRMQKVPIVCEKSLHRPFYQGYNVKPSAREYFNDMTLENFILDNTFYTGVVFFVVMAMGR